MFAYRIERLVAFHLLVMEEMKKRGYNVSGEWFDPCYRGKSLGSDSSINPDQAREIRVKEDLIYPEHDREYLRVCLQNLLEKGAVCRYFEGV